MLPIKNNVKPKTPLTTKKSFVEKQIFSVYSINVKGERERPKQKTVASFLSESEKKNKPLLILWQI